MPEAPANSPTQSQDGPLASERPAATSEWTAAWYCARTRPKHEHIAAACVESWLGFEVFLPRVTVERAGGRAPFRVTEPLFPCYIFVRCRLEDYLREVRYVNGISSLVQFGQNVPAVPDELVDELRCHFDGQGPTVQEDLLQPGSEITLTGCALEGTTGKVVRVMPGRQRVQVLLQFLGRTAMAEVERRSVVLEGRCLADLLPGLMAGVQRANPANAAAA